MQALYLSVSTSQLWGNIQVGELGDIFVGTSPSSSVCPAGMRPLSFGTLHHCRELLSQGEVHLGFHRGICKTKTLNFYRVLQYEFLQTLLLLIRVMDDVKDYDKDKIVHPLRYRFIPAEFFYFLSPFPPTSVKASAQRVDQSR